MIHVIQIIKNNLVVGKSNIISRYTYNRFLPEHEITIGCEFMSKNVIHEDRSIRIQLWDTAGQEAFRAITRSYYKNSACAIIVYDITNKKSFENVKSWLNECKEMCSKDILLVIIGNKSDLNNKRTVSIDEGKNFAEENNVSFFETSALNGEGINEVFQYCVKEIVERLESGKMQWDNNSSGIKIGKFPSKDVEETLEKKKTGCC